MNKTDWIFTATKFLLANSPTTNAEDERRALLDEADGIEIDEEGGVE